MKDVLYEQFQKRWNETTDIPPQTVGPLTPYYKMITKRLKVMPWPILGIGSLLLVIGLFVLFGSAITRIVSLLQKSF